MDVAMKSVRKLRVHWPIGAVSLRRLVEGDLEVLKTDPGLSSLFDTLESCPDLGDFGNYRHVFESSLGFEGFTASAAANPTFGRAGERTLSPTFVLTTYLDADLPDEAVSRLVGRMIEVHPWEVPVIELSEPVRVSAAGSVRPALGRAS
ncbi:hypothetical protein ASF98_15495 [Arthrobacter sp. Leaf337]|nr:hypothetical protein ASF98_15495 [Arthrobacter sp. Leaf337]